MRARGLTNGGAARLRQANESRQHVVVLQPADFRDGDDVVWHLVWAAWRQPWKAQEITSVDA